MHSRRLAMAALSALLCLSATAGVTAAKKPDRSTPAEPTTPYERPLTQEEERLAEEKVLAAEAWLAAHPITLDLGSAIDSCSSPTGGTTDFTTASAGLEPAPSLQPIGGGTISPTACYVPGRFLPVEARDQTKGIYCAPAVGQVIANYSWAMRSGRNKYTQAKIAGWMGTDANGGTSAPSVAYGLNKATIGSPRRPAIWSWVVLNMSDRNHNGTAGDELHGFVRSNIDGSAMPLAIPVKPHDPSSHYYLSSWPNEVRSPGHWIAAYGWYGYWTGTRFARIYYTDSSRDEGGSTGKYWDPTWDIAAMIMEHSKRIVW